jgi:transcriptional regulator with XRE-family HTH domain
MVGVGSKIRIQRLIRNYSQQYMSFMLEISQAAYSNIESGKTELTLARIYEIAEILEISPFDLMPPPKFGTGINFGHYIRTLFKFKKASKKRLAAKHDEALKLGIVYRDTSKNLE